MRDLPFVKMHGIGNDYVYVDGFRHEVRDPAALARVISDRHRGVGSDGLILLLPPSDGTAADLRMRMFNADGSESEMCGNGIRCVCRLAHELGISRSRPMSIETGAGVLALDYETGPDGTVSRVTVDMGRAAFEPARVPVMPARLPDLVRRLDALLDGLASAAPNAPALADQAVSMGNPHVVLFVPDVGAVPLERIGPMVEHDPAFPGRVNLHVVEPSGPAEVRMRTWERGSGITLACGTGAAAVCAVGFRRGVTAATIRAHLPGGDLTLAFDAASGHVRKTGPATIVFRGIWPLAPGM
ncbi:MAG: diaminopimelate epimerase [Phycisphaeraceae bacterium]|nr:diaminopimelate epimerase [Phycisphaeraceae bacterium]